MSTGEARSIGPIEGFLTFNPAGRALKGAAQYVASLPSEAVDVVQEGIRMNRDSLLYAVYAAAGRSSDYQFSSAAARRIARDGSVLPTAGNVMKGAVKASPVGFMMPLPPRLRICRNKYRSLGIWLDGARRPQRRNVDNGSCVP
jgi:hypothetical protein